jgi:hypothetical protein
VHDMTEHSVHRKYEQRVREHIQRRFLPKGFATSYPPPERWKGFFVGEWLMSMNETLDHSRLPVVVLWLTLTCAHEKMSHSLSGIGAQGQ